MVLKSESAQPNNYFNSLDVSLSCPEPARNSGKENKHDSNNKKSLTTKSKQLPTVIKKPTPLAQINN